ncbi:hypothetical protein CON34_10245 [Bacillus thuringiensis]|uniref:hypothetical protein n=1 Tax=Bacillus thuringiensis TaxID=1428 RepID=UPI000BEB2EFF|nr:hypothetical protein [Bacillus thuringiensis]MED4445587.1 hypothetical protein [Bacillus cereus]PEB49500.1 hypothetical protein COM82_02450 [Bacillus thuringiensis]PED27027.1 hypothetical protein CON34_10245 [Bacillus thuringiensis]
MRGLDLGGLKSNWEAFKEFVEGEDEAANTYYFVFVEDNCDEAFIFTRHSDLDDWLSRMFWEWERYDTRNIEDAMDDIKVWKLLTESDFQRLGVLYGDARKTLILKNDKRHYRRLIPISVEPTVTISTDLY